jgi:hypothetical protein
VEKAAKRSEEKRRERKLTFINTLKVFSSIKGRWKIDFIKNNNEKGYVVIENGKPKKALLKVGKAYYKGNSAFEYFVKNSDQFFLIRYIPEENEEIFESTDEQITFTSEFIDKLLTGKGQAESGVSYSIQEKDGKGSSSKDVGEKKEQFFGIPEEHVLVYAVNGKVKKNDTELDDEVYEDIERKFTQKMVEMGKGSGDVIVKGTKGGYFFHYRPGEVIFMLLTEKGIGDLLLNYNYE